jgi:Fe-S cluster biogenesis protein NfuA
MRMTTEISATEQEAFIAELEATLDEMRPYVESHGGVLNLVEWLPDEGRLRLQLAGNCHGCPMSMVTMKLGIERIVQDRFSQVKVVEAIRVEEYDYPELGA